MFITFKQTTKQAEQDFDYATNLLAYLNNQPLNIPVTNNNTNAFVKTFTAKVDNAPTGYDLDRMLNLFRTFYTTYQHLDIPNKASLYETFHIPKRSGGLRLIHAPLPPLKNALNVLKDILENHCYALAHNAAHAYVKGRGTVTDLQAHQANTSKWFLKIDLKNFFPSCSLEFIIQQLSQLFPFKQLIEQDETLIRNCLSLGILDDGLPQGTPLSPLLTNLIMVPIDYEIQKYANKHKLIYTRYADDIILSSKAKRDYTKILTALNTLIPEPLKINQEKTRYGSSAGRNWNLGLMLNKDNNITIGHKQKQRFKATLNNFLNDLTRGVTWDKMDVQVLAGQVSYYNMIEPDYTQYLCDKYATKFGYTDLKQVFRSILREGTR